MITLAAITSAIAIAACGSSAHSLGAASGDQSLSHSERKVSECMRAHGVPNLPDPSCGGGGFNPDSIGINPQSPAFESAQQTCFKLLPGGGPGAHPAQAMAQALLVSKCMRRHRVSGFPDPALKPPSNPNRAEYSIVEDRDGAVLDGLGMRRKGVSAAVPRHRNLTVSRSARGGTWTGHGGE